MEKTTTSPAISIPQISLHEPFEILTKINTVEVVLWPAKYPGNHLTQRKNPTRQLRLVLILFLVLFEVTFLLAGALGQKVENAKLPWVTGH